MCEVGVRLAVIFVTNIVIVNVHMRVCVLDSSITQLIVSVNDHFPNERCSCCLLTSLCCYPSLPVMPLSILL